MTLPRGTVLCATTYRQWLALLWRYRFDLRRLGWVLADALMITAGTPLRAYEYLRYHRAIDQIEIKHAPLFVIGHWRSGTTLLHNYLCLDDRFGYMSTLQAAFPFIFLSGAGLLCKFLSTVVPRTRPFDNMVWSPSSPQEEEVALGCLTPYSFQFCFVFPRHCQSLFRKTVLFEGEDEQGIRQWRSAYRYLLKKLAFYWGDARRLVLKNPANTARIEHILQMFPDAQFIHIHRNPYEVFESMKNMHRKTAAMFGLQEVGNEAIAEQVLVGYRLLMKRYFETVSQVPKGNLIEVTYEDLVAQPLEVMRSIYRELRLGDFSPVESKLKQKVKELNGYQTNRFSYPAASIAAVRDNWQLTLEKWRYSPPPA